MPTEPEPTAIVERPRPTDPMALLALAVEKGMDATQLEKLTALHERWTANRAKEAFASAMCEAQAQMPAVLFNSKNKHTGIRYANLEAVNKTCKPIYTKAGFSISFGTLDSPLPDHVRIVADVRHALGHCERYQGDIPLDGAGSQGGKSQMNAPQATGSTYSYGQRYMLKMIFNLTLADEDDDGQGTSGLITGDQIGELNDLIDELSKNGGRFNLGKFCEWLGVARLDELTHAKFLTGKADLLRKIKDRGAK